MGGGGLAFLLRVIQTIHRGGSRTLRDDRGGRWRWQLRVTAWLEHLACTGTLWWEAVLLFSAGPYKSLCTALLQPHFSSSDCTPLRGHTQKFCLWRAFHIRRYPPVFSNRNFVFRPSQFHFNIHLLWRAPPDPPQS